MGIRSSVRGFGPFIRAASHPEHGGSFAFRATTGLGLASSGLRTRKFTAHERRTYQDYRGRLRQCVSDQMTEFNGRKKARENRGSCYQPGRYRPAKRSHGCRRQDSSARAPEGGGFNRGRSPDDSDDTKDSKYRSLQKAKEERRKKEAKAT